MYIIKRWEPTLGVSMYSFYEVNPKEVERIHQWIVENYSDSECLVYGSRYLLTDENGDITMALKLTFNCILEESVI